MRILRTGAALPWAPALGVCAAVVLLSSAELAAQCAMCRNALTQSAEGQRWSHGINAGITLLLTAPFLIAGVILAVIFHAQVRQALQKFRARLFRRSGYRKAELAVPR